LEDIGKGNGKYYTVNVPLKGGVDNTMYNQIFSK
jgi:acetoin utilization deacetylase AcuC-like enzyme